MAYCVNCGVELGAGEEKCPLCQTPVYHPNVPADPSQKPYPAYRKPGEEPVRRGGVLFLLTMLFVLPIIIAFLCDILLDGALSWFPYAGSSMLLLYVVAVLPVWFVNPNPVVFTAVDFAAAALFRLAVNIISGGSWFMTFAFPVTGAAMAIVVAVVALVKYVGKGYLFIYGGMFIAIGGYSMLIEFLLNLTFGFHKSLMWSYFHMSACAVIGITLIVIALSPGLRKSLHKKFFF